MGGSRHRKGGLSIVRSPARTRHFNKREGRLETGIFPSSARSCQSISAHGSALLRLCNKTLRPRGGFCAGARTARAGNGPEEGSRRTCAGAATSLRVFHRPSDFSCCPLTTKVSRSRDHAARKPRLYAADGGQLHALQHFRRFSPAPCAAERGDIPATVIEGSTDPPLWRPCVPASAPCGKHASPARVPPRAISMYPDAPLPCHAPAPPLSREPLLHRPAPYPAPPPHSQPSRAVSRHVTSRISPPLLRRPLSHAHLPFAPPPPRTHPVLPPHAASCAARRL